jgi:hypothetical protein
MSGKPPVDWTPEMEAQLRQFNGEGVGRNESARRIGVSVTAVYRQSQKLGLHWDRTRTSKAVAAIQEDTKARRADLMAGLMDDAERMRVQLFEPYTAYAFGGRDGKFNSEELPEMPPAEKRALMSAIGTAVDKSLRLAEFDSENNLDKAKAVLGGLGKALAEAFAPAEEPDDQQPA